MKNIIRKDGKFFCNNPDCQVFINESKSVCSNCGYPLQPKKSKCRKCGKRSINSGLQGGYG